MALTNQIDGWTLRDSAILHVPFNFGLELASPALNQLIRAMWDCKSPPKGCYRPIANWRHGDRKVATLGIAQCHSIYAQSFSTKFGANIFGLSFRVFENGFFGICFQCFVNNISEKLNIFRTFSWPIPPKNCWYSRRGATLAPPTMRELRTSLAWIFNVSHALMTGLQHDRDAWTGRWVSCNSTSSVHWLAGLVPAELHVHGEGLKILRNFRSL